MPMTGRQRVCLHPATSSQLAAEGLERSRVLLYTPSYIYILDIMKILRKDCKQ